MTTFQSLEICAGAGGQALGLEQAGFGHVALVEIDHFACATLRANRPDWNVIEADVKDFDPAPYRGVDLVAGGVPCPPFSIAGKQLGADDERDLFPEALRIVAACQPKAVMIENVRGILEPKFAPFRQQVLDELAGMGYHCDWRLVHASDFGVPQLRPRAILVGLKTPFAKHFHWPEKKTVPPPPVGEVLFEEMASLGWENVRQWRQAARKIAPTLVGGSKKHGGPDLGPTRAKKAWAELGVDGRGLADHPPINGFDGMPRLTVRMTALLQGFPREWQFSGKKTPQYRQIGNAFPPPVAKSIGESILKALQHGEKG